MKSLLIILHFLPNMKTKYLELSYEEYINHGKSIADTTLGKYVVYEKLDKGAFGTVYRGMDDTTKKEVAVKLMDLAAIERDEKSPKVREIRRRLAKTESEMMSRISSSHVMKLLDVFENKNLKIMVIQYCNEGTLSDMIYKRGRIPEDEAIEILKQIILGISEMHQANIIHRDLKSQNIMSHNGVFKIVDLGFAKMLPSNSDIYMGTVLGTIITMAPEVMRKKQYGVKADIWSIGVIFYQMIYGQIPFEPMRAPEMYEQIITKDIFPNQGKVNGFRPSKQVLMLMKQILVVDQNYRLSWDELISQKIFQKDPTKLPPQYRVTVDLNKINQNKEKKPQSKTQEQRLEELGGIKLQPEDGMSQAVKISKLTNKQKQLKKAEIDLSQKQLVKQVQKYYLECLKTQFFLREIILPIQQQKFFNFEDRKTVELLVLLSSRCYCNMSNVKYKLGKDSHELIDILMDNVKELYAIVKDKHKQYDQKLKKIEDKFSSIVSDRFKRIFANKQIRNKDIIISGVQVPIEKRKEEFGCTKDQQIEYTMKEYIKPMLKEKKNVSQLSRKLECYKKINDIEQSQLEHAKFHQIVEQILHP